MSTINIDEVLQFAGENKKRRPKGGAGNYYSIKKDRENCVRILEIGRFVVGQHWNIAFGANGQSLAVKCPQTYDGSPCPACEMAAQLAASGASKDEVRKYRPQEKYPMLVLDMNEPEPRTPKIFEAPVTVFDSLVNLLESEEYRHILNFNNGHNLVIKLKKEGNFSKYHLTPKLQPSKVDVDPSTFTNMREALRPDKSYEEIQYAMNEGHFPENEEETKQSRFQPEDDVYFEGEAEEIAARQERPPTPYRKGLPSTKVKEDAPAPVQTQAPYRAPVPEATAPAAPGLNPARSQNREMLKARLQTMKKGPVAPVGERA